MCVFLQGRKFSSSERAIALTCPYSDQVMKWYERRLCYDFKWIPVLRSILRISLPGNKVGIEPLLVGEGFEMRLDGQ